MNLDEFAEEFRQEVLARCTDEDSLHFREDKFTEVMIEYLSQANEIDDGEVCYHKHNPRGEKLNGYSFSNDGECVDILVCCYRGVAPPESTPVSEVKNHLRWARNFLSACLNGGFQGLEESSPVFDLAQHLHNSREDISRVRLFFLTDGVTKNVDAEDEVVDGVEVSYHLWDMEKLYRFITSGMQREVIEIDFVKEFGGGIPCLGTADATGEYRTFLAFFPGMLLAKLYGEYGPRLLEKNVRSFLQAKGNVNKGIRQTILTEQHRFLAYNNGISATAESIRLNETTQGVGVLEWARDFQVVNGGQTTASIYHAFKKDDIDIGGLTVQVKLTVLNDPKKIDAFVPLISRYANSQNKVNAADFSANHPFHVRLEELSRTVWVPAASGTERQTHWYYERARGSYLDDKSRQGTPAQKKVFEAKNPLRQKFTKTDLAKYENTWNQYPHLVCLGAEKNFIRFTDMYTTNGYPDVTEEYFQRLVAKAILFKTTERLVSAQQFGGFRANIVTYTLAWLSHHTAQRINLERIWKEQALTQTLDEAITTVSQHANRHIVNPPPNRRNPGEWSKRPECWEVFRALEIAIPKGLAQELVDTSKPTRHTNNRLAYDSQPTDPAVVREVNDVMMVGENTWFRIARWAKETNNLEPWQRGLAFSLGKLASNGKTPSGKQAHQGKLVYDEAIRLGFSAEEKDTQNEEHSSN